MIVVVDGPYRFFTRLLEVAATMAQASHQYSDVKIVNGVTIVQFLSTPTVIVPKEIREIGAQLSALVEGQSHVKSLINLSDIPWLTQRHAGRADRSEQEICQKLDANWWEWYQQVATAFRGTVRASSTVECMNSVQRMHQSRHRTITQACWT